MLCATVKVEVFMHKPTLGLRTRDWVGSAVGFATVLGFLVAFDPRVAHTVSQIVSGSPAGKFRGVTDQFRILGSVVLSSLKDQSADHVSMLVFTVAAVLLFGFMVRT